MKPLLHWLGRAALVLYVLLVIVVLGVRYWLLPQIDQWRTPFEQALSAATDSEVQIGRLSAQWQGLLPQLQIDDLRIQSAQNTSKPRQQLRIPQLTARFKWQSLLDRQLQFSYLRLDGLHIDLWRDAQQKIHLFEQAEGASDNTNKEFIAWLGQQERIELRNAQLIWRDQSRDAKPLRVSQVNGVMQFNEEALHFSLAASLQAELGQSLQLRGEFTRAGLEQHQLDGQVYAQLNELSPAAWRQWIDLPPALRQASLDTQLWLQLQNSQLHHLSLDTRVYNGVWQLADGGQLKARSLRVFAAAPWKNFKAYGEAMPLGERLQSGLFSLEIYGHQLSLKNSSLFADDWQIEDLAFRAERDTAQKDSSVHIQQLAIKNQDVQAEIYGTWQPQGTDLVLGELDLFGSLHQLQIKHLYKYMPMPEVSAEVVQWLEYALVKGVVPEAALRIKGNWQDFPYQNGQGGLFYLGGPFVNAEIDYYQPDPGEMGWPKLEKARGDLVIRDNGLWVSRASAVLKPNGNDAVQAQQIMVHIDNLDADEPILTIQGQTAGAAQAYLGLMSHSDLGALLDHAFEHSSATGQWQVPLSLRINLENEDQLAVEGSIGFTDNTVQLLPFLPPLQGVNGRLHFNEKGALAENLQAQWLGGAVTIKDKVGPAGQMLNLQGQATVGAVTQYTDIKHLDNYIEGGFAYQLQVGFDAKDQFYVQGTTDLKGVQSTLPLPLAKSAQLAMPLQFIWQAYNDHTHQLQLEVASKLQVQLIENTGEADSSLFSHGRLSWQQPLPEIPTAKKGFAIDIQQDHLDLDAWREVQEQMHGSSPSVTAGNAFKLQDLTGFRLKSNHAMLFDNALEQLTYTMQQGEGRQWRADISSKSVAGTVQWQESDSGEVMGEIAAKLQRLHWAPQTSADLKGSSTEVDDFELHLPSLRLTIDDLRWQRWRLGALRLEGVKHADTTGKWQISHFSLQTPYGDVNATGVLQQTGLQRGLTLTAQAQSEQAGELLKYVGLKEVLEEGRGSVHTQMQWLNFPWSTELDTLNATIDVDLYEGRIDQINSRAAKVLEFLSLQSLSRLSRLDFDIRGLLKDGFPFDDMKGRFNLQHQRLSTNSFRVMGPAGTIVIEGETNIDSEQLDLKAVVVPNVDMSGAAIAAGIALNPVVGIGAFVTQLLFKDPLAKAMTVQYELIGPWDQFEAEEIKLKPVGEPEAVDKN